MLDYSNLCLEADSREVALGRGANVIPPPKERSLWLGFLDKFKDPLIVVLLVVFVFSVGVSVYEMVTQGKDWTVLMEPMGVLMALLLATGVGFVFEVRAEREFRVLNQKKDERMVKVLRRVAGQERPQLMQVMKCDVVVGDLVRLESGDEVPADGRLVQSESLLVDESAFTGEMYAAKHCGDSDESAAYPADFLLRGSIVLEGHCLYRVEAVGMETEEGRGARIMREEPTVKTPLNRQLDSLGRWITRASYLVAILIVVGRMVYYFFFDGNPDNDRDLMEVVGFALNSVMLAVTLIVVAVPEGLPLSVTISLALSMKKMLKENNLVRKLHACETMGAATVVCTDKTGTLTENRLRVMDETLLAPLDEVALCVAVNSTAELDGDRPVGNPTEGALLLWLEGKGIDYRALRDGATVVRQEAFSPETKRMTTEARVGGRMWRFVKGAPELVLGLCNGVAGGRTKEWVAEELARLQRGGRRTLAFAAQRLGEDGDEPLRFVGFVGMADPIRADVPGAVAECQRAGVDIIMVTGDVALTAEHIAREVGITAEGVPSRMLTGAEFAAMDDAEARRLLPGLRVLSRARPADKARLVGLLQDEGHVVAVTGDGTNDAPALKKAQVGLSMGDGTARAKEASDITIIDNSFSSINKAILWGRSLYLNIKRFILFQMTINVCACLIVLFGAFVGLDSPLNVTQMLWVNLIMDTFAAMALASLPPDPRVMCDKPRSPRAQIIDRRMTRSIVGVGLFFFVFLFGLWQLLWHCDVDSVHDLTRPGVWQVYFGSFLDFGKSKPHLSRYELGVFFTFFVIMQFWNLFNARYFRTGRSLAGDLWTIIRQPRSFGRYYSRGFVAIALVILVGQFLIVNCFGDFFGVSALSWADWGWTLLLTLPILLVGELVRLAGHRRR